MKNNKPIKVAMFCHVLSHYREPIYRLLCQQDNMEFTFFSDPVNDYSSVKPIDPSKAKLPIDQGGIRWRFVKNIWLYKHILWQKGVIRSVLSREFNVIIFEGSIYFLSTWVGAMLARVTGKRVLMWTHGFLRNERGVKSGIRKAFYRLAHGLLLYHNRAKDILVRKGFFPQNLYVVYNSLDYDNQIQIRERLTPQDRLLCRQRLFKNPSLPILLFIGRLTLPKKLDMILHAVQLMKKNGYECNILFVGDGPMSNDLVKMAQQMGLTDQLYLYGACYDEHEIARLINAADICVAPGEIGLTCMHSLVYGTPVITHDNPDSQGPEYEAITPGQNGVFFQEGDNEDLARIIEQWLMQHRDREKVAQSCYKIIDEYYNPHYQCQVIYWSILGHSFMRETKANNG